MLKQIEVGSTYRNVFDKEKVEVLDIFKSKDKSSDKFSGHKKNIPGKKINMIKYKKQNPVTFNDRKDTVRKLYIFSKPERVFEQTYMI